MRRSFLSVVFALIMGSVAYSGICFHRSGGNIPCPNGCAAITAIRLPGPGGPWTLADCAEQGLDPNDVCSSSTVKFVIPAPNATSGNNATGYIDQGTFNFVCNGKRTCSRRVVFLPFPTINCFPNPITPCNAVAVFTASGGACPPVSAGGS